jgi:hypothetical protein
MGPEPQKFNHLSLLGFLIKSKLPSKSQYLPDLTIPVVKQDILLHSQTGEDYNIAEIGDYKELLERLAKYDHESKTLKYDIAKFAINYFLDRIPSCAFITEDEAFSNLNMNASVGFGAKRMGIKYRRDPLLPSYLSSYVELSKEQFIYSILGGAQKDEIRVLGKTPRLFTSYPVEHTFLSSIVLSDFLRQFFDNRFCINGTVSSVGDALQNGALATYKYELSKRKYLYCSDTSGQDASVSPDFLHLFFGMLREKYELTDSESNMFETVRENSVNKVVLVNGLLYLVPTGIGSGDYLTIIINIMWRLYIAIESYSLQRDFRTYFIHNTTIINGDDFISSSDFADLNLNSEFATITWAGKPVSWNEMDFCSCVFEPFIHHDPNKVLSVLYNRKKRAVTFSPYAEMQRLSGLLRTLSTRKVYNRILYNMIKVRDEFRLYEEFQNGFISYEQLFSNYNCDFEFHSN